MSVCICIFPLCNWSSSKVAPLARQSLGKKSFSWRGQRDESIKVMGYKELRWKGEVRIRTQRNPRGISWITSCCLEDCSGTYWSSSWVNKHSSVCVWGESFRVLNKSDKNPTCVLKYRLLFLPGTCRIAAMKFLHCTNERKTISHKHTLFYILYCFFCTVLFTGSIPCAEMSITHA